MRGRWDERLIGLALLEVCGREEPPDLTEAILRSWSRARGWRRATIASAAVVLLGLGALALALLSRDARPVPYVQSESPLSIASARGARREDTRLLPGDRAYAVGSCVLHVPGSGLVMQADDPRVSLLEGEDAGVPVLHGGRWTIRTRDRPVQVMAAGTRLQVGAATTVELVPWYRAGEPDAAAWLGGKASTSSTWEVHVESGLARAGTTRAASGEGLLLGGAHAVQVWPAPTEAERARLGAFVSAASRLARSNAQGPDAMPLEKAVIEGASTLREALRRAPALWRQAAGRLEPLLGNPVSMVADTTLGVLLADPALRDRPAMHAALAQGEGRFRMDSVLAYGERTEDPIVLRIVEGRLRGRRSVFDGYPALYLAQRGSGVGTGALEAVLAQPGRLGTMPATYLGAAAGMSRLGVPEAWHDAIRELKVVVRRAVAQHDLATARWLVAVADYFAPVVRGEGTVSVVGMSRPVVEHQRTLSLESAGDVLRVLDRLP